MPAGGRSPSPQNHPDRLGGRHTRFCRLDQPTTGCDSC
jgi:hypothetical protein